MFNEKNHQVDRAYLESSEHLIDTSKQLAKMLILLTKALKEAWDEKQEQDKIAVKIGEETYNLVEDKDEPDAYKWEKVDLSNDKSRVAETEQPFTDYQAQTLATKIITEAPDNTNYNNLKTDNPAIQIVSLYREKETVLYEMSEKGQSIKNAFTQELSQEKIIDVAYEALTSILPPDSPLLLLPSKDNIEHQQDFNITADEMLSQVVDVQETGQTSKPEFDNDSLIVEKTTESQEISQPQFDNDGLIIEDSQINVVESQGNQKKANKADFIAGATYNEVSVNESSNNSIVQFNQQTEIEKIDNDVEEVLPTPNNINDDIDNEVYAVKKTKTQGEEEPAANYTYREVASNPEVEPKTQQWAKQSTVPIEKIKHREKRNKVELENNEYIANAATEMLKKYGTIENDGSRIYRSDAFAIRKKDGVVSIHRRGDEAKGFKEPLLEFKLGKKGAPDIKGASLLNNLKGNVTQNHMLPVEMQEFLIVAEQINEGKGLPDLQSGDVREIGNTLGSLAPAGTLRTLEIFKKTEMLEMLNFTLNQVQSDEVKAGDFTITRKRDQENNRASLVLTKDNDESNRKKVLVRFDLEKTPEGIKSEVIKMNISDYDIRQVKHIAQNAYKLDNKNLESNFDSQQPQPQQISNASQVDKTIGDIPVEIHPWIDQEWSNSVEQNNNEIVQKLELNGGKLPIANQREIYDKIAAQKVTQGEVNFPSKKDITADLMNKRSQSIKSQFTPKINISQKAKTAKKETPRPVKRQEVEF
ncbi:MAG: hypothetical protein HC815_05885 [Richelia sp. RM1_1_1]|nr:hypothetical protein [Richelia sp. RM1_1_1]